VVHVVTDAAAIRKPTKRAERLPPFVVVHTSGKAVFGVIAVATTAADPAVPGARMWAPVHTSAGGCDAAGSSPRALTASR